MLAYQYLEKLPEMAKGSSNKTWLIPMQFGDSLEQFAKALSKQDEDGVFRYEPSEVDQHTRDLAEESDPADWFNTESAPEIAAAVAQANEHAKKPVDVDEAPLRNSTSAGRSTSQLDEQTGGQTDEPKSLEARQSEPTYGQPGSSPLAQPANPQQPGAGS